MTALSSFTTTPYSRSPVLSIIGGLHRGGGLSLDKPKYVLGAGLYCDLVFSDVGVAQQHLCLRINNRGVAIEALGGDVLIVGKGSKPISLPMGNGHSARLPVEISVGDVRLRLEPAQALSGSIPVSKKTKWLRLCTLVVLVFAGSALVLRSKPSQLLPAVAVQITPVNPNEQTLAQARRWFEQQLQTEGLHAVVLVEAGGQLLASGSIERSMKSRWVLLQQAYDQRFGAQWSLRPGVTARAESAHPRVRFQAVWFGNAPYVINDNGKRLYPGAVLKDNWVLERIEAHKVVLSREEERFTLTL